MISMDNGSRKGKIQTVLGLIRGEDLGMTLPHEHLFIELGLWFKPPVQATLRFRADEKIARSHPDINWFRIHPYANRDNTRLMDEREAVFELERFKAAGGASLVDVTLDCIGRDPDALYRVSKVTGVNIIMGCGYYVGDIQPNTYDRKSEESICQEIVKDIIDGVGCKRVKAGIIGEVGCSWPLHEREKRSLRASALAQQETGAAITIHPGRHDNSPREIIKMLKEAGADLERVIICHIDRTPFSLKSRLEFAEAGCTLEYDLFGWEGYYPLDLAVAHMPNDVQRIKEIIELREHGYIKQVLVSHDICYKTRRYSYGGHGYDHLLENAIPVMLAWGLSQDDIDIIMKENPSRLLSFKK
jgi:phosphotriesterase-related protein